MVQAAPRRPRSPRGEGETLRADILDATERLALAAGTVDDVSIRAIADAVGVTPPSIYLHFANRDELIFAMCERRFQGLEDATARAASGVTDPIDALRAMGEAYVAFGVDHPEEYRIMFMCPGLDIPTGGDERVRALSGFDGLVQAVSTAMEAGRLRDGDPFTVACALWVGVHGLTSLLISKPSFPWPDDLVGYCLHAHLTSFAASSV